jgi:hypothetical protein
MKIFQLSLIFLALPAILKCQVLPEDHFYQQFRQQLRRLNDPENVEISPERQIALRNGAFSLVIPGVGQVLNAQYVKAAAMLAFDIASLVYANNQTRQARRIRDEYHAFGDANFSVVKYAAWIVEYNRIFGTSNMTLQDLAMPGQIIDPTNLAPNAREDWSKVDIQKLRALEMQTLFGGSYGTAFSHVMPDYGSQQYYELISKYYQFGPGWKDYTDNPGPRNWTAEEMSPSWFYHGSLGKRFNDNFRAAELAVNLVLLNHFVSALDAFIVRSKRVKSKVSASEVHSGILYGLSVAL